MEEVRLSCVEPAEAGLDSGKLSQAKSLLMEGIRAGEYTAATCIIARHSRIAMCEAMGTLGGDGTPAVRLDSVFDMASITKPSSTAASLLALVDNDRLSLDQQVTDFFPERAHLDGITLKHLATHTSGLPAWRDLYSAGQTRDEAVQSLLDIKPDNPPGINYAYSCMGYIMLQLIIERVSGKSLGEFAAERIFRPLGMAHTRYNPPSEWLERIAHTADCPLSRRKTMADVQDGNALAMGGVSGNAGLFSTAPDLAVFAQSLLNGGEFNGKRILSDRSVKEMFTNRIDTSIGRQAIGFFMPPNDMLPCEEGWSDRCAGHTGYTGTSLVIDPEHDTFVVLLANKLITYKDASDFFRRRRLFHALVVSAMLAD